MPRTFAGPLLVALAAFAATAMTLAPDGAGSGITCDEPYHVYQGKQLVLALRQQGWAFFRPENIERNFDWPIDGPPVQAPLGYWILGWTQHLFDFAPENPDAISIAAARLAPAAAFALLILMIGAWTARREGAFAGTVAAAAVALMPRLFGHAHLASLDMLTTFFFVAAVLAASEAARTGRTWHYALAGVVWGLAMLVRLHGLLVAPPVLAWLVWQAWKGRERLSRIAAWTACGMLTFFVGWPWLWLHPVARFQQYLSSGPMRQSLHVFYAGRVWADHDVPWHYPWVMFAVTVPLGLLVLGMFGVWAAKRAGQAPPLNNGSTPPTTPFSLLAGAMLFMLVLFSLPNTPVYDGTRLFLMAFPFWAVWVGIGAARLAGFAYQIRTAGVLAFVALQGVGLILYAPCHLSYYNLLVGGLAGAERLGFEATYWGDTVREPLLAEAARRSPGKLVLYAPNLAPFQVMAVEANSPALRKADVHLVTDEAARWQYAIIYHRRADSTTVDQILKRGDIVAEYSIQGVWLARLVRQHPLDVPARAAKIDGLP